MRKQTFSICENKGADQLRSNSEADHRLCFRYSDSHKSISRAIFCLVCVGPGRKETPKPGFLASRHISIRLAHDEKDWRHSIFPANIEYKVTTVDHRELQFTFCSGISYQNVSL